MLFDVVLAAALAQGVPAEAATPAQLSPGDVITNPDWAALPSAKDLGELYPPNAARLAYAGLATVSCVVLADGRLSECKVIGEEPEGRDFGKAAMKMSEKFRMKPRTLNGQPVAGGTVKVPIRFIHPGMRLAPLQALQPSDATLRQTALQLAARFRAPQGTPSSVRVVLPIDFRSGLTPTPPQ